MDLLPRVGSVDPQASERRPGTGAFARKRKDGQGGHERRGGPEDEPTTAAESPLDPLLAELDRLRAIDPALTDSGAHRALLAARAYQPRPGDALPPITDAAAPPDPAP